MSGWCAWEKGERSADYGFLALGEGKVGWDMTGARLDCGLRVQRGRVVRWGDAERGGEGWEGGGAVGEGSEDELEARHVFGCRGFLWGGFSERDEGSW